MGIAKERARKLRALTRPKFDVRAASEMSLQILGAPPARPHIVRIEPRGEIVERFMLPLELCRTTNGTRHASGRTLGKLKKWAFVLMRSQLTSRPTSPLQGRPQVLCVRFSSIEPDAYSDWAKIPVDCLKKLGLIVDDAPRFIDLRQSWEQAPVGRGCVRIEVWTGVDK